MFSKYRIIFDELLPNEITDIISLFIINTKTLNKIIQKKPLIINLLCNENYQLISPIMIPIYVKKNKKIFLKNVNDGFCKNTIMNYYYQEYNDSELLKGLPKEDHAYYMIKFNRIDPFIEMVSKYKTITNVRTIAYIFTLCDLSIITRLLNKIKIPNDSDYEFCYYLLEFATEKKIIWYCDNLDFISFVTKIDKSYILNAICIKAKSISYKLMMNILYKYHNCLSNIKIKSNNNQLMVYGIYL